MKIFLITSVVAIAIASVQAALPLTEKGCQCLSECKTCALYHSVAGCGFTDWQAQKICTVNPKTCDDYQYNRGGKVADKCGSWTDWVGNFVDHVKSWFHKTGKDVKKLNAKVTEWADEYIKAIDIDDLAATEAAILPKLASVWQKFDQNQLSKLKKLSKKAWDDLIAKIPPEDLAALTDTVQEKLEIAQSIVDRLKSITLEDVAKWTDEQWDRVPIDNLAKLGWGALQKVPLKELGKWTKEQWVKIPVDKLVRFTGEQIAKIDAQSLASLTDQFWDKVPVYQIVHFGVELLQSAKLFESLNATQFAAFTASQWRAVPVESILTFTVEKIQAIDYTALGSWTKEQWDKVPIDTIAAFLDKQLQSVPPEVVGNWTQKMWLKFPTEKAIMFTGEQLIAGANALKDMTEEQLAKFDWSQIRDDALAQLPPELQEKIAKLRQYATNFDATEFKKKVFQANDAKKVKIQKLQELQLVNDNPKATTEQKTEAQIAYNVAVTDEEKKTAEVQEVQADSMVMYAVPEIAVDTASSARVTVALLLAALWF